jgi:DNA-binding FadR family transcriptional regulator
MFGSVFTRPPGSDSPDGRKASEVVADKIRAMIAQGRLRPGDSLPSETTLMATFGIARPTMREVIRILESDGLVEVRLGARGGPVVRPLTMASMARRMGLHLQASQTSIEDVLEAEAVIEPAAARLAAARRTTDQLAAMRACVERIRGCRCLDEFAPHAARFHSLIVESSGNATLTALGSLLSTLLAEQYAVVLGDGDDRLAPVVIEASIVWYQQLINAIEAGDGAAAEQIWRRHQHMARYLAADVLAGRDSAVRLYPDSEGFALDAPPGDTAKAPRRANLAVVPADGVPAGGFLTAET